jgi:hypothetical protein
MSLATNTRDQIVRRLKRNIELTVPNSTVVLSQCTSADAVAAGESPSLIVSISAVAVAYIAALPKSFNGFNVVAELSSTSANGLPETDLFLQFDEAAASYSIDAVQRLVYQCGRMGCSELDIINTSAEETLDGSEILYANITTQIANDPSLGGVGA